MAYGYAAQNVDPDTTSKAAGREIPVKPKFGINVARFVKGKSVKEAKAYLEDVIALKRSIPFKTHKRHVKHRRDISGPGQYPVSVCKAFLRVISDAESNAEYKGLDPDNMYVWHAVCHKGEGQPGFMPRAQGRATAWEKSTSHIEIVLKEREEEGESKAKGEAKGEKHTLTPEERKKAAIKRKKAKKAAKKEE